MRRIRRRTVLGWRWRRNPLRRRSDVAEGWVVLATWVTATGVAVAVGAVGARAVDGALRQQRAEREPVSAVVLKATPHDARQVGTGFAYARTATVRWTDDGGTVRTGTTAVRTGTEEGTEVRAWTDGHGRLVPAPAGPARAALRIAVSGAGAGAAGGLVILAGGCAVRLRIERRAVEQWGAEWERVGPQWRRTTR
ncbi:Rv1733c family protein [Streptomyces nodosus]|uniref:Rv1733c family protein n=2 Tax=Streptomyces TaxID=1883 RepID=UPI0036EBD0FF